MRLNDKVGLVTGGASGLGAATARMLVEAGAKVIILDRDDRGEAYAAELGPAAKFVKADVTNSDDIARAVKTAQEAFGGLHVAVNCAGVGAPNRVISKQGPVSLEWFKATLNINLIGSFDVIRQAAFAMSANAPDENGERGVIVNTASVAAFDGQIGQAAYSASKGGIVGMTLPLARDLARHGVRVMTIAPGLFDTPLLAKLPEEAKRSLGEQVPFPPRLGNPSEYASLVRQIAENSMLNGEVIRLDGAIRMAPK